MRKGKNRRGGVFLIFLTIPGRGRGIGREGKDYEAYFSLNREGKIFFSFTHPRKIGGKSWGGGKR